MESELHPCWPAHFSIAIEMNSGRCRRGATPELVAPHELVENGKDATRWQRGVHRDGEALARECVDDVEGAELAPVAEIVVDEIHRPALVRSVTATVGIKRAARSLRRVRRFTASPAARCM